MEAENLGKEEDSAPNVVVATSTPKGNSMQKERRRSTSTTSTCDGSISPSIFSEVSSIDNASKAKSALNHYEVPIAGYEIMEARARFTIFKLNVQCKNLGQTWPVFRRYSDFSRLHKKLRKMFPDIHLLLPAKRWFGDNFDSAFLETRMSGLQSFVNQILDCKELRQSSPVRKFFCFDDPPSEGEEFEASRERAESLEGLVEHLHQLLKEKDQEVKLLKLEIDLLKAGNGKSTNSKDDTKPHENSTN